MSMTIVILYPIPPLVERQTSLVIHYSFRRFLHEERADGNVFGLSQSDRARMGAVGPRNDHGYCCGRNRRRNPWGHYRSKEHEYRHDVSGRNLRNWKLHASAIAGGHI